MEWRVAHSFDCVAEAAFVVLTVLESSDERLDAGSAEEELDLIVGEVAVATLHRDFEGRRRSAMPLRVRVELVLEVAIIVDLGIATSRAAATTAMPAPGAVVVTAIRAAIAARRRLVDWLRALELGVVDVTAIGAEPAIAFSPVVTRLFTGLFLLNLVPAPARARARARRR